MSERTLADREMILEPTYRYVYRSNDNTADVWVTVTFVKAVDVLFVRAIDNDILVGFDGSTTTQDGQSFGQPTTVFAGQEALIPYWGNDTAVIADRAKVYIKNATAGKTFSVYIEGGRQS